MKKQSLIAIPLFIIFTASVLWMWFSPGGLSKAPDIKLAITDGTVIELQQLRGKPVLVTFWATSCIGCVREMPHLIALYDELSNDGLEIIGIAMPYDPPNQVVKMISEREIPYPIAIDIDGNAILAFGDVLATPTSFLIAPDGTIAKHTIGEMDMGKVRDMIIPMLPKQDKVSSIHLESLPSS
ncbi:MAG: TlpA family protein disulfide reductase [Gammaproteobacteria bacterium]|nr:TlpA family protein disulfide reductase [Gammaproteobacteria bacterium]